MDKSAGFTPFPEIRDLGQLERDLGDRRSTTIDGPILLNDRQFFQLLDRIPEVKRAPQWSSGIIFIPDKFGHFGMPFCRSSDPEVTCWPSGPGPDDDPQGYVCVCTGPTPERDRPEILPSPYPPEECVFEFQMQGGGWAPGCRSQTCNRTCNIAFTKQNGMYVIGCTCS